MGLIRSDAELAALRFPQGADNTTPEHELPAGAAREIVNLDVSDAGGVRTRPKARQALALNDPHSLFAHEDFPYMLLREGGAILAVDPMLEAETVLTTLGDEPVSWCYLNGEVLWTAENRAMGRIDTMLQNRPLGLDAPIGVPSLTTAAFGGLAEGLYRVSLSATDDTGLESGMCEPAEIRVAEGERIVVGLPSLPAGASALRVYVTEPDGAVFYHAATSDSGPLPIVSGPRGAEGETLGMRQLPPGHIIRELNGVPYVAFERWLVHGTPMRPFLTRPASSWLGFKERIDMVQPIGEGEEAGLFVASGKRTFFIAGGVPGKQSLSVVRAYGAVPGSGCTVDGGPYGLEGELPAWVGRDGVPCLGLPGGTVRKLGDRIRLPVGMDSAAMLLRQRQGISQMVVTGSGGQSAAFSVGDIAEVRHYRNGKLIS